MVIYNVKGYLNPRWRLMTIDLRSKSYVHVLRFESGLMRNFAADLSLQIFNNHQISIGKVWLELLVANLATNFQDLVAKAKNLVALAPVLGAILRPAITHLSVEKSSLGCNCVVPENIHTTPPIAKEVFGPPHLTSSTICSFETLQS